MGIKVIASFATLYQLAHKLGKAKLSGDKEAIKKAHKEHDAYKKICMEADEVSLHCTYGDIS